MAPPVYPPGHALFEQVYQKLYDLAVSTVKAKFPTVQHAPQHLQYLLEDFLQYFTYNNTHPLYKFIAPQHLLDFLDELENEPENAGYNYEEPNFLFKLQTLDYAIETKQLLCICT
jgi:hypothetical protein